MWVRHRRPRFPPWLTRPGAAADAVRAGRHGEDDAGPGSRGTPGRCLLVRAAGRLPGTRAGHSGGGDRDGRPGGARNTAQPQRARACGGTGRAADPLGGQQQAAGRCLMPLFQPGSSDARGGSLLRRRGQRASRRGEARRREARQGEARRGEARRGGTRRGEAGRNAGSGGGDGERASGVRPGRVRGRGPASRLRPRRCGPGRRRRSPTGWCRRPPWPARGRPRPSGRGGRRPGGTGRPRR